MKRVLSIIIVVYLCGCTSNLLIKNNTAKSNSTNDQTKQEDPNSQKYGPPTVNPPTDLEIANNIQPTIEPIQPIIEPIQPTTVEHNTDNQKIKPTAKTFSRLSITNICRTRLVFLHRTATFQITIKNSGSGTASDLNIVDTIPPQLEYVSSSPAGVYKPGNVVQQASVRWKFAKLNPGETIHLELQLRSRQIGTSTNIVTMKSGDKIFNAEASLRIKGVSAMHLSTYDTEDPVEVGKQTIYVMEVRNEGTSPCTSVVLKCKIAEMFEFIEAWGPVSYQQRGDVITFAPAPILEPGEKLVYKIACKAVRGGSAKNQARIHYDQFEKDIVDEEGTSVYADGIEDSITTSQSTDNKTTSPNVWQRDAPQNNAVRIRVGEQEFLELRALRVMTKIEGLRARTIVDHIFFNPYEQELQGSFKYALPEHGSVSYFAFYPDFNQTKQGLTPQLPRPDARNIYQLPVAKLMAQEHSSFANVKTGYYRANTRKSFGKPKVAHVASATQATEAYEEVVRQQIDPAILEWAGGNVFSARVFPIRAKNYQRVVIAYDQTLPKLEGKCHYQFHFPKLKNVDIDFMLVSDNSYASDGKVNMDIPTTKSKLWTTYQISKPAILAQNFTYQFTPDIDECIIGQHQANAPSYLYGRLTPQLPKIDFPGSQQAIFILDTSFSQQAIEFGISVKLLERILKLNPEIEKFNILFFNVETRWLHPGWIKNTPAVRKRLFTDLSQILLEGATDIGATLRALTESNWLNLVGNQVDIFFFSNGQYTWGEMQPSQLLTEFRQNLQFSPNFYCYNLGTGTTNHELLQLLQNFNGNIFSCYGEAQIDQAAIAHKQAVFTVEDIQATGLRDLLFQGNPTHIYPGQQLLFAAQLTGTNPKITIKGRYRGKPKSFTYSLRAKNIGFLAPRAFGELAVSKLQGYNSPKIEKHLIALCQHFVIPGKSFSLVMLENQGDYQKFAIELNQHQQLLHSADILSLLADDTNIVASKSAKEKLIDIRQQLISKKILAKEATHYFDILLPSLANDDFILTTSAVTGKLHTQTQVPKEYLAQRKTLNLHQAVIQESERRYQQDLYGDTIRCISTLVEQAPEDSQTLRIVAHYLWHKNLPGAAAQLFHRIQQKRPFEPHPYRNLARCYAAMGRYKAAACYYEIVLGGKWHSRFGELKTIVAGEYKLMLNQQHLSFASQRLESLSLPFAITDIIVTMSWNTDSTDIDLWVIEPGGEKCFYRHPKTRIGGTLSRDITGGYGPERYKLKKAVPGKYKIIVHNYAGNRTRLSNNTFVEIAVTTNAGSAQQQTQTFYALLKTSREAQEITQLVWPDRGAREKIK